MRRLSLRNSEKVIGIPKFDTSGLELVRLMVTKWLCES